MKKDDKKKVSSQHWEMHYNTSPGARKVTPADAFDPKVGKYRPTTHLKVNETDH